MAVRRNFASRALYALAHLMAATSALRLPGLALPTPQAALDSAHPEVTAAPQPDFVELRFMRRADAGQCASSCVSVAVVKSTNCRVDDYSCGCQPTNAYKILNGAQLCIVGSCGYAEYAAAMLRLQGICATVNGAGAFTGFTVITELPTGASTVLVVTNTGSNGRPDVSTVTVALVAPTSTAPSSTSSAGSSSQSASSSSGSMSSGAIAGIAVGAAGGAILLCAALFFLYRRKRRDPKKTDTGVLPGAAAVAPPAGAPPAGAAAPYQPELDSQESKAGLYASTASPAPTNASSYPGFTPSPMTAVAHAVSPSSPPPVYPGVWQQTTPPPGQPSQQQPAYVPGQQPQYTSPAGALPQNVHEVPGGREAPNPTAQEVSGASAAMEMTGDTHLPQEMPYQGRAVYEMPSTAYSR